MPILISKTKTYWLQMLVGGASGGSYRRFQYVLFSSPERTSGTYGCR